MLIVPNNWAELQHYKDRSPPWIKLHKKLLDHFEFQSLPVASRALAPMLWLLASEHDDGVIDADPKRLAFRLRMTEQEAADALQPLITAGFFSERKQPASKPLAKLRAVARPETETEEETEAEETSSTSSAAKLPPCPHQRIVDLYHEVLPELPSVRLMSDPRRKALAKTWAWVLTTSTPEGERRAQNAEEAMTWLRRYFERARENDFLMGRTVRKGEHAGWQCDLDFLLTERGMKQVIEKTRAAA